MKDFGVYVKYVDPEAAEQTSKGTPTGLIRALISGIRERDFSASSETSINVIIRTAVFSE